MRRHTAEQTYAGGTVRAVDYTSLITEPEARLALTDSLSHLASIDPSNLDSGDERLAFWLNLYNAWVIGAAVDAIDADPSWGGVSEPKETFALFGLPIVQVGGVSLSLNMSEHGVIRGDDYAFENYVDDPDVAALAALWHEELWAERDLDARIHVGLNCASLGCPDILAGAFQGDEVWTQLDAAAAAFVSHPGKGAGPDGISQLFSWFRADFERSHGSAQGFVSSYRTGGDADVDYDSSLDYSWELNAL